MKTTSPARKCRTAVVLVAGLLTVGWVCVRDANAQSVEQTFMEFADTLLVHEDRAVREETARRLGAIDHQEAYAALEKAGFLDWPMWQYDAARSADIPWNMADELHMHWVRELPMPKRAWPHQWDDRGKLDFDVSYSPVVKGDTIFVPSNVTDSVTAYRIDDGEMRWRYYADGPVRLAPAAWNDNIYFVSDDGHLYCLDAATGALTWKFRGGPSDQRLLGNERIISFWPARGGPVLDEGVVYFTAGFWPLHGVFIYALDAETGDVIWVNDATSSDYVGLPHEGAYGYGGLAPQGYLAIDDRDDRLVVSGGRAPAGYFDRHTGEAIRIDPRDAHKGGGGYAVHASGMGMMRNEMLMERAASLANPIDGEIFNVLAAHGRLFITTTTGRLYCFGPEEIEPVRHAYRPTRLAVEGAAWAQTAQDTLDALGESQGYALMLGAGSGDLLREFLVRSDLHIVLVESDSETVRTLRDELSDAGLYGRRAAVIEADPATFAVQPYLFSMVVSEDIDGAGIPADREVLASLLDRLMPYKGVAYWGASTPDLMVDAARRADVDQVHVERQGDALFARRSGPLTGAGQWTHQLHDAANTMLSKDERVRLPLGLLWFGGPNNHNILPRHTGGPRPQIAAGRQVYLGVETLAARCVYTGRQLWEQEFPGVGHSFTKLELEERWSQGEAVFMGSIPGATYIGSPFVTLPDSIYLRYGGAIHRLDPATGNSVAAFALPGQPIAELHGKEAQDWGHTSVQGDFLITTAEPHIFEDQELGWTESYSGTSSKLLAVLDRHDGSVLWERRARIGFRHNAIVSAEDTLFVIDGVSEAAIEHMARRGQQPAETSVILALDLQTGEERWRTDSNVFGMFLLYSDERDILIEGGNQEFIVLEDEPRNMTARNGSDGSILWERGRDFVLPGALLGDKLIPGWPGTACSLLTGEDWVREQPYTGERSGWSYHRRYGCNRLSASQNLLLFRSGYAGFYDLEHDTGTGTFGGFRSGCTANLIAADGVLNALDYTRSCTCSYQVQTSLALVHMPGDSNIELWTRYAAAPPDPKGYGVNFGAPGRRVDADTGIVWHDDVGARRRHPSAILDAGDSIDWVAASCREINSEEGEVITVYDLIETRYTVRLHFAELTEGVEPGERVFSIVIDGNEVQDEFDVVATTGGGLRATVQEFTVQSGMTMTVELRKTDDSELDPIINGIELIAHESELARTSL